MRYLKRIMDISLSALALIILSPVFLAVCIWICLDSPGPVFFRQKRVGIHKTHFNILKFRTMRTDTPSDMPTHLLKNPEQYITKSGRFLRKTSLDELPQLINILKGDMSIVGPRPALWNQYDLIAERDRYGANDVLPGLTGWAQIHGRDTLEIPEKAKLDGYYVAHWSLWMDVKCIFLTGISVLKHEGVQEGGTGTIHEEEPFSIREETPLVSVVVATYHREKELKRALASLANQTYSQVEVILVDDNAEKKWNEKVERAVECWKEKTDSSLIYIQNVKNLGSAASRNRGIQAASGKYVTFLDDDDKYMPEKIAHQVVHMQRNQSDFSITDLALYNEKGKLEEKRIRYYLKPNKTYTSGELLEYHLLYHLTGTDTLMFRRKYLEAIGGFPPIDVGDEFYLMKEAITGGGRFSYLPCCDVKALVHTDTEGLSSRGGKIRGENKLYEYKKTFFAGMKAASVRRIRMRHHLVLAYAYLRNREYLPFAAETGRAFLSAPVACVSFVLKR